MVQCLYLKRQLLQSSTSLQALDVANLIISKARLAQAGQPLQPLDPPQTLVGHAQLHHLAPPGLLPWTRRPTCSAQQPSELSSLLLRECIGHADYASGCAGLACCVAIGHLCQNMLHVE